MIIFNVTAIIIITLMLLGLTYGFFVTRITGNTAEKSISVETGFSEIKYTDLTESEITTNIYPGYETIKLFTIQNTGNMESYYSIALFDVENNFERTQDVVYTLYRKPGNNTINTEDFSDCTVISSGTFPTSNAIIKSNETLKEKNEYYTYALKITYVYSYENQNVDQGKTFSGKVTILPADSINNFESGSLTYEIISNAQNATGEKSMLAVEPLTIPAKEISGSSERILTSTLVDKEKVYYYRGNIIDNYVEFANKCWRIVNFSKKGLKLILEDNDSTCKVSDGNWNIGLGYFGYDIVTNSSGDHINKINYLDPTNYNSDSMVTAFYNFQQELETILSQLSTPKTLDSVLNVGNWCLEDKVYSDDTGSNEISRNSLYENQTNAFYDSYIKITKNNPAMECNGTILSSYSDGQPMYVGTISANEYVYSGGKISGKTNNYLLNEYQKNNSLIYYTLTPSIYSQNYKRDYVFGINNEGKLLHNVNIITNSSFRPSVVLKQSITITSGDGTKSNPYIIG